MKNKIIILISLIIFLIICTCSSYAAPITYSKTYTSDTSWYIGATEGPDFISDRIYFTYYPIDYAKYTIINDLNKFSLSTLWKMFKLISSDNIHTDISVDLTIDYPSQSVEGPTSLVMDKI